MAITARHFGYKPVDQGYNFTGYTDHSFLIVQDVAPIWNSNGQVPGQEFNGFEWVMGPDEDRFDWVIAYTAVGLGLEAGAITTEGEVSTPGYEPDGSLPTEYQFDGPAKKIAFRGGVDADFLGAANDLTGQNFTTEDQAVTWLNSTGRATWTNHTAVDEGLSPTPATTTTTLATTTTTNIKDGGGEGYEYYNVYACGGNGEITYQARVPLNSNLKVGFAYDATSLIVPAGWEAQSYVIAGPAEEPFNPQLIDPSPNAAICE